MKRETVEWLRYADQDILMASMALEQDVRQPCVLHCQQALEKTIKAIWIEKVGRGPPPRTHDLGRLAAEVGLEVTQQQKDFLYELTTQFGPSRYPDVGAEYTRMEVERFFAHTEGLLKWLRQQVS